MTFDRRDFTEFSAKQRQQRNGADLKLATMLRQAAVSATDLTADPKWNVYVQYLQAGVESMTKLRDGWARTLTDPGVVDHEQLLHAKIGWATADATIKAWQVAIGLPKDIAAAGDQARDVMSRFESEQPT